MCPILLCALVLFSHWRETEMWRSMLQSAVLDLDDYGTHRSAADWAAHG